MKLWLDLCRIARKQQIWDICRVSCRFLILYDRRDLIDRFLHERTLYDIELVRNLAEAHFILGEAIVQFIRNEGIEVLERPGIPEVNIENHHNKNKLNEQVY